MTLRMRQLICFSSFAFWLRKSRISLHKLIPMNENIQAIHSFSTNFESESEVMMTFVWVFRNFDKSVPNGMITRAFKNIIKYRVLISLNCITVQCMSPFPPVFFDSLRVNLKIWKNIIIYKILFSFKQN